MRICWSLTHYHCATEPYYTACVGMLVLSHCRYHCIGEAYGCGVCAEKCANAVHVVVFV